MGLKERIESFEKAYIKLREAVYKSYYNRNNSDYEFFRDSAIQRFEISVESFWKCIKIFLKEQEGIICNSPKSCIREMFSSRYITLDEAEQFMEMIDDRN
jgi:nucleotidyltransferase substrate binding protein (TIGR01987 family)